MKKGRNVVVVKGSLMGVRGKVIASTQVTYNPKYHVKRVLIAKDGGGQVWIDEAEVSTNYEDFRTVPRKDGPPIEFATEFVTVKLPTVDAPCY